MLVNPKSAKKCCKLHEADYGHSNRAHPKQRFTRSIKRRDRQAWKKEVGV